MPDDPGAIAILSRDRLDGFTIPGRPNTDNDLVGRYFYNLAVSQALYPLLHGLEVVLRNRIHDAAACAYPIDPAARSDYHDYPCWIDATAGHLIPDHRRTVDEAKRGVFKDVRRRYGQGIARSPRMRAPGRLVAKLSFAFWVFLFDDEYGDERRPGALWPRLLNDVFPVRHGRVTVAVVRKTLRRMLVVRNRTMHYERIAPYSYPGDATGHLDPKQVHLEILDVIHWMCPRAASALRGHGSWDDVHSPAFQRYMQWLARRL